MVIVVIAIPVTLVAPNICEHVGAAEDATARSQMEMLGAALDAYRLGSGTDPTPQEGPGALWQTPSGKPAPNWNRPYRRKAVPGAPWRRPYVLRVARG